ALLNIVYSSSLAVGIIILSFVDQYKGSIDSLLFGDILAVGEGDLMLSGFLLFLCIGFIGLTLRTQLLVTLNESLAIAIGHFFGGPEPETRLTIGLANSTRNAGLALALATLNFKDQILPVADSGDGDPGILAVIAAIALLAFVMDAIYANIYQQQLT
ncbi:MAG: hypothetical protein GVY17_10810, partial [Cyanobacteria bacterium]|nr:hypothetical protein [Cyanobacteria bacterium GSL.Bin21]